MTDLGESLTLGFGSFAMNHHAAFYSILPLNSKTLMVAKIKVPFFDGFDCLCRHRWRPGLRKILSYSARRIWK